MKLIFCGFFICVQTPQVQFLESHHKVVFLKEVNTTIIWRGPLEKGNRIPNPDWKRVRGPTTQRSDKGYNPQTCPTNRLVDDNINEIHTPEVDDHVHVTTTTLRQQKLVRSKYKVFCQKTLSRGELY